LNPIFIALTWPGSSELRVPAELEHSDVGLVVSRGRLARSERPLRHLHTLLNGKEFTKGF